jgi:hypothetical protein
MGAHKRYERAASDGDCLFRHSFDARRRPAESVTDHTQQLTQSDVRMPESHHAERFTPPPPQSGSDLRPTLVEPSRMPESPSAMTSAFQARFHTIRTWALAGSLVALAATASCGRGDGLVSMGAPVGSSYDGPLYLSPAGLERGDPVKRFGAASQVVGCSTRLSGGVNVGLFDGEAGQGGPASALETADYEGVLDRGGDGYRLARIDGSRVLFTYDVDGVTKQAVIVRNGPTIDRAGWYVESWARCDLSELRSSEDPWGAEVWMDSDGSPAPTTAIVSYPGPEHCDWQQATFLYLDNDLDGAYVRNPPKELLRAYFAEPWEPDVALPADAIDTGYSREGNHLWLSQDRTRAYVGTPASVELWPQTTRRLGCA